MDGLVLGAVSALWLGILTSISPCPLATNVAAISFVARHVGRPRRVLVSGLLYTAGRTLTYVVLGVVLIAGVLAIPAVSMMLQRYMNKLLGPILILVGMFLLELLSLPTRGRGVSPAMQRRVETGGVWTAGLLGVLFALSFCPVSAALFFGSLVPLAVKHGSRVALPSLYGVGTAIPVLVFAVLVASGAHSIGKVFDKLTAFEWWARRVTGVIFVGVGVYYSLAYIFRVL